VIGTLDEAWNWYQGVQVLTRAMARLGRKYWENLPWDGELGRDDHLKSLQSTEILDKSNAVLDDLDDLRVLLLFSVFESIVRERALAEIESELQTPRHPALRQLVKELNDTIGYCSFSRVLEAYKLADPDLVESVNQVRRYRNWVAHGRKNEQPDSVTPRVAHDRLQRFLDGLMKPPEPTD
jgi:hypothetical protein